MQVGCTPLVSNARRDLIVEVAFLQLTRSLLLLLALAAPLPAMAQYGSSYQQPRPYNPYPGRSQPSSVPSFQQRYPEPQRSGQTVIYQNGRPKVCHAYANTTICP